ncbi:hypothetical protein ACIBAC_42290 [Streptomyces sp. NPDC051362]|uniref:hypothetical protein n=1 Tax=Streptomyces sp. NPDC051362 TaxID=3365651 RepID=UPI0037A00519
MIHHEVPDDQQPFENVSSGARSEQKAFSNEETAGALLCANPDWFLEAPDWALIALSSAT